MIPQVKWWRAKTSPVLGPGRADWFVHPNAYPGFVVSQPPSGNVRLFRDLDAFKSHDGSFSVDLPLESLDQVEAQGGESPAAAQVV